MKNTGITRKVDDMGRIVLPIELRRNTGIEEGTSLEIYVDESGNIVLRPMDNPLTKEQLELRVAKPVYATGTSGSGGTWIIVQSVFDDGVDEECGGTFEFASHRFYDREVAE